jgi:hypothetical protein
MVAVLLLAVGAFACGGALVFLRKLRDVRVHGSPLARTAQEDYATNPCWLELSAKLYASAVLLASGAGVLWLRRRCGR